MNTRHIERKDGAPKLKHLALPFEVKSVDAEGRFSGYLAVFGNRDAYGDTIRKGAFKATLKDHAAKGRKVVILWQHRWDMPLGVFDVLKEDDTGLYVEGQLLVADVRQAAEAHALMKAGAITGMSIGFETVGYKVDKDGNRELTEIRLWEGSIVTFPANEEARIDAVKSALEAGNLPTVPEFEKFLREAGFSKTQAVAIANGGLVKLLRSESGNTEAKNPVSSALAILRSN
ncbi:HK97 family phage prohead protease [Marilutibacter spongiae]|uniref:HK97 family phage prohead protease n=1 Tax=Marilutibacter spongiae TaxID=2025720 RepID=A0A7W3Y5F9_9GAMM|nr:HK97 family phage prohead protease [Lysobacter spongiae]MBB1060418.1 HK97 family phage prohead protease [Lysobacter spongiae]